MNRRPRLIEVDGRPYAWRIIRDTPTTVRLRIWADGRASPLWAEVVCPCDDLWLDFSDAAERLPEGHGRPGPRSLAPRQVAQIIRLAIPLVELDGAPRPHRVFELRASGNMVLTGVPKADGEIKILPHLLTMAHGERQRLMAMHEAILEKDLDWPDEFDANDIALFDIVIQAIEIALRSNDGLLRLSGKPLAFLLALIPGYLVAEANTLSQAERAALAAIAPRRIPR